MLLYLARPTTDFPTTPNDQIDCEGTVMADFGGPMWHKCGTNPRTDKRKRISVNSLGGGSDDFESAVRPFESGQARSLFLPCSGEEDHTEIIIPLTLLPADYMFF
jgi:hypothetical protein